jgi:putative tryptophan/tyrosine transport system substrate-binding protein
LPEFLIASNNLEPTSLKKILLTALIAWLMILPCSKVSAENAKQSILIISSSGTLDPFRLAIEGFKKGLQDAHIPAEIQETNLGEPADKIVSEANQLSPDLIVAVGSAAAHFSQEQLPGRATVFSMVLYPAFSDLNLTSPQGMTGVAMDVPLEKQFQTLLQIVPGAHRVGVLFNPAETGKVIQQAKSVCGQTGLTLIAIPVNSTRDVPAALNGIENKVDVLWSVADGTVFSGKMPEFILEYTLQHNLPFMGISPSFVEAGALFSLAQDYFDIGQQTAEISIRVLAGAKPSDIAITSPRKISLYLNLRAANEIGLKIPQAMIQSATKVIR